MGASPRLMQAVLVFWVVIVGMAYATGTSPVFGLIGIIIASSTIMVLQFVMKKP